MDMVSNIMEENGCLLGTLLTDEMNLLIADCESLKQEAIRFYDSGHDYMKRAIILKSAHVQHKLQVGTTQCEYSNVEGLNQYWADILIDALPDFCSPNDSCSEELDDIINCIGGSHLPGLK